MTVNQKIPTEIQRWDTGERIREIVQFRTMDRGERHDLVIQISTEKVSQSKNYSNRKVL